MQDLDITPKMAMILKVFLEVPDQPRYGFELMKLTGLASGSLYPMLARMERAGWLTRGKEHIGCHVGDVDGLRLVQARQELLNDSGRQVGIEQSLDLQHDVHV